MSVNGSFRTTKQAQNIIFIWAYVVYKIYNKSDSITK